MKTRYLIQLLFLSITIPLIAISCGKSDDEPEVEPYRLPYLKMEQEGFVPSVTLEVSGERQTISVRVLTNRSAKTEVGLETTWIKVGDRIRIAGSELIEFTYDIEANDTGMERTGHIVVSAELPEKELGENVSPIGIKVIQSAASH
ncbi:MAG: BACON domain-containing protein [Bacteroidaceae bacterium]|nr:BACON domain-containing protein [Bacteroidaceae bacterium]